MTVGDIGCVIVIDAGGYSLTGSTCALLAAPGKANETGPGLTLTPVVVAANGLTASYVQTGKDFNEGGPWQLQLQALTLSGQTLTSPPAQIYVFPRV